MQKINKHEFNFGRKEFSMWKMNAKRCPLAKK